MKSKKKETELNNKLEVLNEKMAKINKKPLVKKTTKKTLIKKIKNKKSTSKAKTNSNGVKLSVFEIIVLSVMLVIVGGLLSYQIIQRFHKEKQEYTTVSKELQTFIDNYNYITDNYYGEIDKNKLIMNAIDGMLSSLDEHSTIIDENNSNTFNITLEGEYQGLGVQISNDTDGNIIVMSVFKNSPAEKSGITPGDIISKMDEESLYNVKTSDFVNMVKEKKNAKINLSLIRGNEVINVDVTRENIIIESVTKDMLDNKMGYIYVNIFASNTYTQFKDALESLEKNGLESLIIDLRGNTGGHLDTVKRMLYLFLDNSHIIYQTQDKNGTVKVYSKGTMTKKYPIVVLMDSNSASASEIMAATLQEEYGAKIVGTTSYGKGTVQELQTIAGVGQYKFTTKKWLTPKGNWIHKVGIKPDYEVILDENYFKTPSNDTDNQLQKAISVLKGA